MIRLDAKDYLCREGDPPTCGYLIERGTLEVLLERDGSERVLAIVGPGEIVGEMALIDQAPRTASVRAREACLLLPITAAQINKRLETADPVLRLVLGTVLERFRGTLAGLGALQGPRGCGRPSDRAATSAAMAELRLEKQLEAALRCDQIVVHYQPIVKLVTGRLAGFEALARWSHPERGLVPPSVFVPIAEASGLSGNLTLACLRRVAADLPAMQACAAPAHADELRISVNLSGADLMAPDFVRSLGAVAAGGALNPQSVTLELTETALVHSPSEAAGALESARSLGFHVAVDDFGTGYSSLNYVRTLPVDSLKIDQSFVQAMTDCDTTRSIVDSMLQLAETLDIGVVGEGVETAEQHALLQMLGCEYGQGYLFGRPLPIDATLELIAAWRSNHAATPFICAPSA